MANEWMVSWEEVASRGFNPLNIAQLTNDDSQNDFWTIKRLRGAEEFCRGRYEELVQAADQGLAVREIRLFESNIPIPEYTDMTVAARQALATKMSADVRTLEAVKNGLATI